MTGVLAVVAHGLGGRSDLPLPVWLFAYGAGFALLIWFVALRILWPSPRLASASGGVLLPPPVQRARLPVAMLLRAVGLAMFVIVLVAASRGVDNAGSNIAPVAVFIVFWQGMQAVSVLLGNVWASLNPLDTLAAIARLPDGMPEGRTDPGHWSAAAVLATFFWVELAYYDASAPRAVAVWLGAYSVAALVGAGIWGRAWLRYGEGFAALFELLSHLSPFFRDGEGRLRARVPLTGLADVHVRRGTAALVLVTLGSTTFDGLQRSRFWSSIASSRAGWSLTLANTLGLIWMIALVALAYQVAIRVTAKLADRGVADMARAFVPSLIPIVFAYAVAHYFSNFLFEGQNFIVLASDPLGRGWDLFGTIDNAVNFRLVSTRTIAYVQAAAIVVGHVAGVTAAHDRAVELFPPRRAVRSQYPLLGVMILYTVGGLTLLLGG